MVRRLIAVATLLALGGCSLIVGLSDLSGDGGVPDASDAGDASDASDATPDVSLVSDCGHTFCENFDEDAATPFAQWATDTMITGGTISLTSGFSPPNAFMATTPGDTPNEGARLEHDLPSGSTITADFEVQTDCAIAETNALTFGMAQPLAGMIATSVIFYKGPSDPHIALEYVLDGGAQLDASDMRITSQPLVGWKHYRIVVDFVKDTATLTDRTDGGSTSITAAIAPHIPPSATKLYIGVQPADVVPNGCSVVFDDIIVDVQP
jgi:hypothetical protein